MLLRFLSLSLLLALGGQEPSSKRAPLKLLAGVWEWSATFSAAPDAEPLVLEGRQRAQLLFDGRWLATEIISVRAGITIEGRSVLGCPEDSSALVGLSIGSTSSALRLGAGRYDSATRTFVLRETRADVDGVKRGYRIETRVLESGLRKEVWRDPGTDEARLVARVTYIRRPLESWVPLAPSKKDSYTHLAGWAGEWDCSTAEKQLGVWRERVICDGLWLEAQADWKEREWRGFLGYDRLTGKWNGVAFGRSGGLHVALGEWDEDKRTLKLDGDSGPLRITLEEGGARRTLQAGKGAAQHRVVCVKRPL